VALGLITTQTQLIYIAIFKFRSTSTVTIVIHTNKTKYCFRALDNFSTQGVCHLLGQGVFDSPSLTLVIRANIFKQILDTLKVHFKAFGVVFLHNKVDKTYQAGHFHKKNFLLVKTYF
jgi:hypothetical protein